MSKEEPQIVDVHLSTENCPAFLEELRKMAEESVEKHSHEVGHDIICIGSMKRKEYDLSGVEKFAMALASCNVEFRLVFDNGTTCKIVIC